MPELLQPNQEIYDGDSALPAGDQDAAQDGMGISPTLGPIAPPGLAGDDGWPQSPFSEIVGGIQPSHVQEA
jgi:hypothetical protein